MKMNKKEREMIEGVDPWMEDGEVISYTVYLKKGWAFHGEDGGSFCEDTWKEVKETLKHVTQVA